MSRAFDEAVKTAAPNTDVIEMTYLNMPAQVVVGFNAYLAGGCLIYRDLDDKALTHYVPVTALEDFAIKRIGGDGR